jgi:hypothetical protein
MMSLKKRLKTGDGAGECFNVSLKREDALVPVNLFAIYQLLILYPQNYKLACPVNPVNFIIFQREKNNKIGI